MTPPWLPRLEGLPAQAAEGRRATLRQVLREVMAAERAGDELGDPAFHRLAAEIFRYQADANLAYGAWVRRRGIDPGAASDLADILPVPSRAFKELPFLVEGSPIEASFRTSGTTSGTERRGTHHVRDLQLYRDSALTTGRTHVHPAASDQNRTRLRVLSLTPPPKACAESSLVYMISAWMETWDDGGGGFFSDPDWQLRPSALRNAVTNANADGVPVILVGTAFSFVRWLDGLGNAEHPPLPAGSVVMETGGFKGRSRAIPRAGLYQALAGGLQVPLRRIVNEYGMTELLSQFYEPVLRGSAPDDLDGRWHVGPSWVRTRVLDPVTLEPAAPGTPGLLCHVDLANLDSAVSVLTEDIGVEVSESNGFSSPGRAFRLLGRAQGAEARGCSLAMEELLIEDELRSPPAHR